MPQFIPETPRLANGLVSLDLRPDLGGRVLQFALGPKPFFWVNPQLAGLAPPPGGLGPNGSWLNYGGEKLWPAPQGWDTPEQWPGPPGAILDGSPHTLDILRPGQAVRLTSQLDPYTGLRFSREIELEPASTRVRFAATMTNGDTRPRRWGLWSVPQIDAAHPSKPGFNPLLTAWCPLHPSSRFPGGYRVAYGDPANPTFQPDAARGLMRVRYQYQVGKIWMDSPAGWVATVDGLDGFVFVQRFVFEPGAAYPDDASVEFWANGRGRFRAAGQDFEMPDDPAQTPAYLECELLSPLAHLEPGASYTWRYEWAAANVGGDFPIIAVADAGVVSVPLAVRREGRQVRLTGRFGVFAPGRLGLEWRDAAGRLLAGSELPGAVTPLQAVVLDSCVEAPAEARQVVVQLMAEAGRPPQLLAQAAV